MTEQTTPPFDKGFFASVPRMVRTGYNQLSTTAKWIYVCLKDLCGENGTCYRTLRTLATEIGGISISTLSEAIRALASAGLISAIKQRRPGQPTAKETWHISIIDIWKQNGESHPTKKCSLSEQNGSTEEQSSQNVSLPNNNVRSENKTRSFRSDSEPKCSQIGTKEEELKKDQLQERSIEEERAQRNNTNDASLQKGISHIHSSDDHVISEAVISTSIVVSDTSQGHIIDTGVQTIIQGGVDLQPAGVKGVSSAAQDSVYTSTVSTAEVPTCSGGGSTLQNDTLNLATSTNVKPEIFAQADDVMVNDTPQPSSYSHSPQRDTSLSPDAVSEVKEKTAARGRLYEEDNQDGMDQCEMVNAGVPQDGLTNVDATQGDSVHTGKTGAGEACVTAMDEVREVTQAEMLTAAEVTAKIDKKGPRIDKKGPVEVTTGKRRAPRKTPPQRDLLAEVTPEVQAVVSEWLGIFNKPIGVTSTLIAHAQTLAAFKPEPGEIKNCRLWMYATDRKKWYSTHGMHLGDVAREFEKFRSLGDIPTHDDKSKKRSIDRSGFSQQSLDKEFYPNKQEPTNQQKEKIYAF